MIRARQDELSHHGSLRTPANNAFLAATMAALEAAFFPGGNTTQPAWKLSLDMLGLSGNSEFRIRKPHLFAWGY